MIVGLMSGGKTTIMSKYLLIDHLKGRDINTNYWVNFPHTELDKKELVKIGKEQPTFDRVSFGLDEFWLYIDSRRSATEESQFISYMLAQTSKDDINLYATSQHAGQIDIRFRNNMHKLSQCSRVLKINGKYRDVPPPYDEDRKLPDHLNDILYIKEILFKRVSHGVMVDLVPVKIIYHKAKELFKLFDTRQKVSLE